MRFVPDAQSPNAESNTMTRAHILSSFLPAGRDLTGAVQTWAAMWLLLATLVPVAHAQVTLPGTNPFNLQGDPALGMVDAIRAFLERETLASKIRRATLQGSDAGPRRERFRRMIGAVDIRVPFTALQFDGT